VSIVSLPIDAEHEPYVLAINCAGTLLRAIGSLAGVQAGDINLWLLADRG
jgi:hypothetical protein